ncbi:MAG TPA: hypothetical protein VEW03_04295 [Longimicrobiaceae bacterium]|nr:hypothetical protein [Longimicrobiaceae bacterium]
MDPLVIPLHDRRERAAAMLELGTQALAAVSIFSAAAAALASPDAANRALGWVEMLAGVLLLGTIVLEVRTVLRGRAEPAGAVSWVNLMAAGVIGAELWQRVDAGGGISRPLLITGVLALVMGFVQPRLVRRRRTKRVLRLDQAGLAYSGGPLRRFGLRWDELASVEPQPSRILFSLRDGSTRTIGLRMLLNRDEVAAAVLRAAESAGVRVLRPERAAAIAPG